MKKIFLTKGDKKVDTYRRLEKSLKNITPYVHSPGGDSKTTFFDSKTKVILCLFLNIPDRKICINAVKGTNWKQNDAYLTGKNMGGAYHSEEMYYFFKNVVKLDLWKGSEIPPSEQKP